MSTLVLIGEKLLTTFYPKVLQNHEKHNKRVATSLTIVQLFSAIFTAMGLYSLAYEKPLSNKSATHILTLIVIDNIMAATWTAGGLLHSILIDRPRQRQ